ncbi:hypothetical protein B0A48_03484 [Cryoendolithus antarcticus]|uniref:Uncharacterized protein n=1 Tax=Cryoendolithus antarcticus TaxID=1507870 RepID=A0A1V8TK55_9PEZI|nr:hypothetical protein B0A48_03484 [Cryoendolithus antarcticus]
MSSLLSARCRLLELAPELRNQVYDHIFTHDTPRVTLSLMRCRGPQMALLLTCKLINKEAGGIYKAAFRSYMESTEQSSLDEDIAHIKTLFIHACIFTNESPLYDAVPFVLSGYKTRFRTKRCFTKHSADYEMWISKQERGGEDGAAHRPPLPVVTMSKVWLLVILDRCSWLEHDETRNDEGLVDPLYDDLGEYSGYQILKSRERN